MAAAYLRLTDNDAVKQGVTFALLLTFYDDDAGAELSDLTGKSAQMQWRKTASSIPVITFASVTAPLFGDAEGTITIDLVESTMLIEATAEAMLEVDPDDYLLDFIVIDDDATVCQFSGEVEVTALITRET